MSILLLVFHQSLTSHARNLLPHSVFRLPVMSCTDCLLHCPEEDVLDKKYIATTSAELGYSFDKAQLRIFDK